jgi:hypothetical protein
VDLKHSFGEVCLSPCVDIGKQVFVTFSRELLALALRLGARFSLNAARAARFCSIGQKLGHQFGAVVNVELVVNPPTMGDRGVLADPQPIGDRFV